MGFSYVIVTKKPNEVVMNEDADKKEVSMNEVPTVTMCDQSVIYPLKSDDNKTSDNESTKEDEEYLTDFPSMPYDKSFLSTMIIYHCDFPKLLGEIREKIDVCEDSEWLRMLWKHLYWKEPLVCEEEQDSSQEVQPVKKRKQVPKEEKPTSTMPRSFYKLYDDVVTHPKYDEVKPPDWIEDGSEIKELALSIHDRNKVLTQTLKKVWKKLYQ